MLLAVDVSFRNFGYTVWKSGTLVSCGVVQTEKCKDRNMYAFAQDAVEVSGAFAAFCAMVEAIGIRALLLELPHGSQSAAAAKCGGYAIGLMACLATRYGLPMEYVTPQRVKKLASGSATATKQQMIAKACSLAPVDVTPGGRSTIYMCAGATFPEGRFEHVADSICLYHAARETNVVKMFG